MTNKEIMQASLLDILFDNRNKDYGAYALRRGYNHRLIISILATLVIAALLLSLSSFHKKNEGSFVPAVRKDSVVIRIIEIPQEKPKEPEQPELTKTPERPKEKIQGIPKISQVKFTNKIAIKEKVKINEVPINEDLKNKMISTQNVQGRDDDKKVKTTDETKATGNNGDKTQEGITQFIPDERAPEFPGGKDALIRFLKINLVTPEELQAGDKKTVEIRFKVGTDGLVSDIEVVKSGGVLFDREVMRVCKKMPRWKPAVQNGGNIAVSYMLPVTFIGVEQ